MSIYRKAVFCTMLLLCLFFCADAAIITSTSSGGNWNDPTTWVGGIVPRSTDDVVIATNATVLMDAVNTSSGILSLTVSSGSTLQTSSSAGNIRFYIKGNITNNGTINLWLSSTQGSGITLTGNSTWSGSGTWNLAQIFIGNFALEINDNISVVINRSVTVGNGSLNVINKSAGFTFVFSGPENITTASLSSSIFYGNITVDKTNSSYLRFAATAISSATNTINVLGNINILYGNELQVYTNNLLDIRNNLFGSGKITGGTTSDIQISGTGNSILFNSGGSGFRNFTLSRPNGATIDSTIAINQNLLIENQAKLYMPAGKSAAGGNQTLTVGGTITGDGYLAQQNGTNAYVLTDLTLTGTSIANLRFSQVSGENIIHSLTINKASSAVNLLDGGFFQVKNTLTLTNGTFNIGSGTLKLTGSISMNLNGNLTGSTLANLIIGNDVSSSNATIYFNQTDAPSRSLKTYTQSRNGTIRLGNALDIYNSVDINSTSSTNILNTASNLTLISNEAGTARVNNLGAASITDSVVVQRFVKGGDLSRRSYRLLSSPVYQVNNANSSLRRFYFSRLQDQILITGNGGTANGFDASTANGSTIWKYNEPAETNAAQDFIPISRISKNHSNTNQDFLTSGNGFFLFFRGDRINNINNKTTQPFPVPENVVLRYKGLLNQGNIAVTAPYGATTNLLSYTNKAETNDGFNLIGNPYASAIDWELSGSSGSAIALTNINPTIYILDPVTKNYGTYTKGGLSTGNATRYVASGQGFFVKANGTNPALTFTEAAKATDTSNPSVLGGKKLVAIDFLRLNLEKDSLNQDDILLTFKDGQSENYQQEEDVDDLPGMNASISLASLSKTEKKQLAVNALPPVEKVVKVALFLDAGADGNYKLKLTDWSDNFKDGTVYLKDNFTADSVDLRLKPEYTFSIRKNNAATFGADRFTVYFKHLPIQTAVINTTTFFNPTKSITTPVVTVFPNPATSEINFIIDKRSIGNIKLNIYNNTGIKVQSISYQNQSNFKQNISKLFPGVYVAELIDELNNNTISKIKFIKN